MDGRLLKGLVVVVVLVLAGVSPSQLHGQTTPSDTDAVAAALQIFAAVPAADCLSNNPDQHLCLDALPAGSSVTAENAQRGIAAFTINTPEGVAQQLGSGIGVIGRDAAGTWHFYFGGQQYYQLVRLPGDLIVCAGGDSLNVRAAPDRAAAIRATVGDLSGLRAEEFVETEPGDWPSQQNGAGWYRISAPVAGWVSSRYVTGATSCAIHDALAGS